MENGQTLGNTIGNNRNLNINGAMNLETLYNHSPYLKKVNDRFKKAQTKSTKTSKPVKMDGKDKKDAKDSAKDSKDAKDTAYEVRE